MKLFATKKSETDQQLLDPWSAFHMSMGLGAGLVGVPFAVGVGSAVVYEVFEYYGQQTKGWEDLFEVSGPEHPANALVDVAVFAAGWYLGNRWRNS